MSAKNRDEHNRFRSITVGFRVSPEENEQINIAVALSGLPKQEYCYRRCLNREYIRRCEISSLRFLMSSNESRVLASFGMSCWIISR